MSAVEKSAGSAPKKTKLEKATTGDIALSLILPGWGILVGLIALAKREFRRSLTMMSLSVAVIAALLVWRSATFNYSEANQTTAVAHEPPIEQQLQAAAAEVQQKAPVMVDADTRLDGAQAGPGLVFTYLYSFPQLVATPSVTKEAFEAQVAQTLRQNYCSSAAVKPFFQRGVVVRYAYRDQNGADLGAVTLTQDSCNAP